MTPSSTTDPTLDARGLHVLVVDDNEDAADLLALYLRALGAQVRVAYDGQAGLDLLAEDRPEVIFHDLAMPGLNGLDVARRIRADPGLDQVLLVAVTGYGAPRDRERTRDAGFDFHFTKPMSPDGLAMVLDRLRRELGAESAKRKPM